MKPMASHQSNENFAFINKFPDIWSVVGKPQNFHGNRSDKKNQGVITGASLNPIPDSSHPLVVVHP